MRVFVALNIPQEIKNRLALLSNEISGDGITPVKAENQHITLRFIGDCDSREQKDIVERLKEIRYKPFECRVCGVGVFPSENYIRVVWAGTESDQALEGLAKDISKRLHGFGKDERFSAHLTLARVKKKTDLSAFLKSHEGEEFGTFMASSFELMESVLGNPGGPQYSVLATFKAD